MRLFPRLRPYYGEGEVTSEVCRGLSRRKRSAAESVVTEAALSLTLLFLTPFLPPLSPFPSLF